MIWRGRENSGQGEGPTAGVQPAADRAPAAPTPTTPRGSLRSPPSSRAPEQQGSAAAGRAAPSSRSGSRVESVLDAAERAAVSIREDAQIWARNYLEESKRKADEAASARMREISDLTDSLVNRARAVAQQSDELIAAMDDAGRRVVGAATPGQNNDTGPDRRRRPGRSAGRGRRRLRHRRLSLRLRRSPPRRPLRRLPCPRLPPRPRGASAARAARRRSAGARAAPAQPPRPRAASALPRRLRPRRPRSPPQPQRDSRAARPRFRTPTTRRARSGPRPRAPASWPRRWPSPAAARTRSPGACARSSASRTPARSSPRSASRSSSQPTRSLALAPCAPGRPRSAAIRAGPTGSRCSSTEHEDCGGQLRGPEAGRRLARAASGSPAPRAASPRTATRPIPGF